MALTLTNLAASSSTSNGAGTASVSVPNNSAVYVAVGVAYANGAGNSAMTISGTLAGSLDGGVLTELVEVEDFGSRRTLWCYRGINTTGSTQSGTILFTASDAPNTGYQEHFWAVDKVEGIDTTTPNGTVTTNAANGVTSASVTVTGTPDSGDFVYAAFAHTSASAAMTRNGELDNTLSETGGGANFRRLLTAYDSAPDGSPTPGVSWSGAEDYAGIAFIINVGASTDPALTGQTGTFTVGAVTPSLSLSISGQTATLTAGAVTPNLSLALVGQSATFSAGAVTPSIDKGITGQTATFSSGSLSPELTVALTGQTATFTSGSVTASTSSAIVLDGQTSTFSSGVLTPEISIALTGQTATFTSGSLASSTDGNVSLMGQTGTFTAGTLSPELALGITGQAATFTAGNVLASLDIGIVGQTATFTQGALTPSLTVELTGQTATFTAGQVGAPSGDLTVALMGQTATFTAGALSVPSTATEGGGGYLYWRKSRKEWEDERKKLKVTPKEITRVAQKVARSVIADTGMADPVETLKDNRAQYAQMAMNELRGFWSPSVQDAITRQIQIAVTLKKRQQQDDEELMLLL